MKNQMFFGETQSGRPMVTSVAGARLHEGAPCQSLFGTTLLPIDGKAPTPGIRAGERPQR